MKVLGIDYGLSRVGLALGDTETQVAAPLEVWHIADRSAVLSQLVMLVSSEAIDAVVVGVPLSSSGAPTKQGEEHHAFAKDLGHLLRVPVYEVDESFTSVESQRIQKETHTKVSEDALAATLILEEFFGTEMWH